MQHHITELLALRLANNNLNNLHNPTDYNLNNPNAYDYNNYDNYGSNYGNFTYGNNNYLYEEPAPAPAPSMTNPGIIATDITRKFLSACKSELLRWLCWMRDWGAGGLAG